MSQTIDLTLSSFLKLLFNEQPSTFMPEVDDVEGNIPFARLGYGKAGGTPYYELDEVLKTEYFMPATITFTDAVSGKLKSWKLPFPILSITSRKNIIETPLTERRGTVKELINIEDYQIKVRGFMIAASNDYPEDLVAALREAYECNTPVSLKCAQTDIFLLRPDRSGSDKCVIRSLNIPDVKGIKNVQPYEMDLLSDEPFSLIVD